MFEFLITIFGDSDNTMFALLIFLAAGTLALSAGCAGKASEKAAPPPREVEVMVLAPSEVRETGEYLGTLVNAYLADGGRALGVQAGEAYVDVGTLNGYREATRLLATLSAAREARRTAHA